MNIIKDYPDNKTDLMFFTSFLAQIAENKGEFNRADSLYNLTLEQTKGIYGDNHLDYFVAKENLSLFYIGQKKFDEAKTLLEECRIARNKFDNKESYKVLFYFYDLYKEMGDYSKAENYLLNANSIILQSKDGVNSPEYSSGLMYLASLYLILNRFDEAEKLLIRSLDLRKKNNEENSFSVANGLINLGVFYQEIGRFNEAERLLIQGNSATKIATGDNSTSYATALNNLAILYYDIGQNDKCIELLKKAIDIDTLNYGSDNPKLALDYINIAGFYSKIKNFEEAEKYVKMALNLFKSLSSEDLKYATILTRAGGFYLDIVDYSKAEKYYIEGLKIIERFLGKNFIEYISPINNLSILYRNMGRLDESKTKILECISILEKNRWINRPEYKTSLFNLAATYRDLKDFDNADSTYNLAIQKSYDLLNNTYPYLSEIEKILYREKIQDDFYYFMNYTVNRYQNNNKIAANFFDIELNTKSKIFDYMKDLRTFSISSNDTNVVNLNKNYYNLKKEIGKLSSVDEKQLMNLGINLDSVVKLANDIEKELSLQVSSLAKINDKAKINWQNINNKLVHGEAAIELVRFPKMFKGEKTDTIIYAALILKHSSDSLKSSDESNKSPELVLLENGNDLEEKYFAKYSKIIRDLGDEYRNGNKLWTDSYIKNMLKDMYINFWQKIQEKLAGVKTVYLSVDGVYNKINLNTLINPETNKYLAEELDLHIVTSTRDLVNRNLIAGNNQSENKTAELFGSPKFNLDSNEINDISKKYSDNRLNSENSSSNNKLSRGSSDTLLRGLGYDELPGTKIEIEKISEILKSNGWTAKTHTGKDATEESVKSVRSPKILHIATHGEFDKDIQTIEESDKMTGKSKKFYENPLLKSKLILAGGENTRQKLVNNESIDSSIEDGYLTAYEVMNMNLDNTELVVLSACETGLGEIRNGEGVYGLQRAFQVAGAKSLIMSLWKVPDAATQELMLSFYSKWLGGMDKRESFRQSQMELAKKYANFFYWGAFEIITNY
jgi:CHAT domain-containing protein